MWITSCWLAVDSVPHVRQQSLHFALHFSRERKQRQACRAAEVAIKVHAILDAGNPQVADHALGSVSDALLLQSRQLDVTFFPRGENLITSGRCETREGENRSHRPCIEGWMQLLRG